MSLSISTYTKCSSSIAFVKSVLLFCVPSRMAAADAGDAGVGRSVAEVLGAEAGVTEDEEAATEAGGVGAKIEDGRPLP